MTNEDWKVLLRQADVVEVEATVQAEDGTLAKAAETAANASAKDLIAKYATPAGVTAIEIRESDGKVTFNMAGQQPYPHASTDGA